MKKVLFSIAAVAMLASCGGSAEQTNVEEVVDQAVEAVDSAATQVEEVVEEVVDTTAATEEAAGDTTAAVEADSANTEM
jgi:PBP1b-binding outer membrane lipoprotein LpoB